MLSIPKRVPYRNKEWLKAAQGQSCVNCSAQLDTTVGAHYQGMRAEQYGKGKGQKPDNIFSADLCDKCHRAFDQYKIADENQTHFQKKIDHSEQFQHAILLTIIRRLTEQGFKLIRE